MAKIELDNVSLALSNSLFGKDEYILRELSFTLNQGDRLALIGRNGAGKSTLLRLLSGVYLPTTGDIKVDGKVSALFNLSVGHRRESSGRTNMIIRTLMQGEKYEEVKAKLPEMEAYADIGRYIERPMETYSQGMAMRVTFSAATAFRPDILLMDEWLGVGDAEFRAKSAERMTEMSSSSGILVLATHNERLSMENCNLGLWIDRGRMKALGNVEEVWAQYKASMKVSSEVPQPDQMLDDSNG
ncbi:ABC transporter ATP-binding protein [Parvularcula flava]|uniref:ABC transporter ATP-binding protein n=1 Tax=Aquisalinus luteolus TaxID=1566827 RepID=A0A8J3A496_9PROT|nr:ATP-binding cassette domain-containing protein [Aquisalinus luteolus]NHK29512.1 ABC transporter ATP-binding protein [Aquisalinus luteolus]GGI01714.1 hypothetical protein GCM10011355_33020 [Aquisalinus luteolus]